MPNELADFLSDVMTAQTSLYRAAQEAGDHSGESACKLQRLIRAVEEALLFLRPVENGFPKNAHCARAKLREALNEARFSGAPILSDADILDEAQERR